MTEDNVLASYGNYKLRETSLGNIYLYKNFVITEFIEGVDISFKNFENIGCILKKYYKDQPFGFVANRKYAYAINVNHASIFNKAFPNISAYAIVLNHKRSSNIVKIENQFFEQNRKTFTSLDYAVNWVKSYLPKVN